MACLRQITAQVDGVKLTAGGTQTTSDTLVLVHHGCTTAQAAVRLRFYLFLGKGAAQICKGFLRHTRFFAGNLAFCIVKGFYLDIILI